VLWVSVALAGGAVEVGEDDGLADLGVLLRRLAHRSGCRAPSGADQYHSSIGSIQQDSA
jgi:hypothetical protein